ncbi:MAG: MBL fold metallo-hydrolase [Solirubrobacterales bacterium]|nr:MBL fold metallo-hydrolase [Solirubrobacterales bacterium]
MRSESDGPGGANAPAEPDARAERSREAANEAALARMREQGIVRLRVPTPFAVGRVNCYLIEDDPLTLIDAGPNSGKALDELGRQLAEAGHRVEDLELIVISHQHIDHLGLVDVIRRRSGAEVAVIAEAVDYVENFGADAERDDEHSAALMRRYGVPDDLVEALRSVSGSFRGWGAATRVDRPLQDGGELALRDHRYEVQLRPGHSPSDTLFWDAERSTLIAGDHLIAHISSNPLLSRPLDGSSERPKALVNYLGSMLRTRELDAELVLPGHGYPITDHRRLIDERFEGHRRRAAKLEALIAAETRTPYELAQAIWGNVAVTQAFLTLSEVVGHVDLLIDAGRVRERVEGEVVSFEHTGGEADIPLLGADTRAGPLGRLDA